VHGRYGDQGNARQGNRLSASVPSARLLLATSGERRQAPEALPRRSALLLPRQLDRHHRNRPVDDIQAQRRCAHGDEDQLPDERRRADPLADDTVRDAGRTHAGKDTCYLVGHA